MEEFNVTTLTEEQEFIMKRFASLVHNVLSIMEIVVSPDTEPVRHERLRSQLNKEIYRVRNEMLFKFTK